MTILFATQNILYVRNKLGNKLEVKSGKSFRLRTRYRLKGSQSQSPCTTCPTLNHPLKLLYRL